MDSESFFPDDFLDDYDEMVDPLDQMTPIRLSYFSPESITSGEVSIDQYRVTPWVSKGRLQAVGFYRPGMEMERTPMPLYNKFAVLTKRALPPT